MNIIELETLGFYRPRFLHLHLNTQEPIDNLNVLVNNEQHKWLFSTFLHEYVHFLQDISTPYGIMRSFLFIDLLKDIIHPIRNSEQSEFVVPVELNNAFNSLSNIQLQELYAGDDVCANRIIYRYYELEYFPIKDRMGAEYQVTQYKIHYTDIGNHEEKSFVFGTTCIKEYMAHTIQSRYYPHVVHDDIPYLVAELICYKEYPVLCKDPMFIVALCDASLKTSHPAHLFFTTLERMRKLNYVPSNYEDIYSFAFNDLQLVGNGNSFHPEEYYDYVVGLILKQYDNLLSSEVFEANRRWLHHLFTSVRTLRLEIPNFILHLVDEEGRLENDFHWIIKILGTPFLTNNANGYGYIPPEAIDTKGIMPYQLLAVFEVYKVLRGSTRCSLYDFCSHRPDKNITNHHCLNAPWERANEPSICPFAQLWISWNLVGKTPINRTF